jgi:DNA-binding MarR family transcriptional regulator
MRALEALRALVQLLRARGLATERRTGLSAAQLFVLKRLAEAPAASVNELAARVHAHQSSVSVVVERLVTQGLVHRAPHPRDGRRRTLTVTPRGRALAAREADTPPERLTAALEGMPVRERRAVAAALEALARAADAPRRPHLFLEPPRRTPRDR